MMELTKERLTALSNRENVGAICSDDNDMAIEALKMALAGMEAEPVFKINHDSSLIKHVKKVVRETPAPHPLTTSERAELENYRNAQQVVPDELANKSFEYIANKFQVSISDAQWILVGWNACRAAMIQASNSPVIPDGWVMVPVEPTAAMNKAGWAAINEHDEINPTYRAMLAAAPQWEVKK